MGRKDFQVKIRGFRVEPGEVESYLLKHEGIKDAVVIAKDDGEGQRYLCAFLVTDQKIDDSDLRKELTSSLPDYMIPRYFINLEKLPLTSTNKVDRKALQKVEIDQCFKREYSTN